MRGTWQTTDGGGGAGLGVAVLVGAALAVKAAPAVLAAAAGLVRVVLIVAGVIVGVGAAGLVGPLTWRWRRSRLAAARAVPPVRGVVYPLHGAARAAQPLPQERRTPELPGGSQRELPGELHLHLHGVSVGLEYTIVAVACSLAADAWACQAAIWYSCVRPPRTCFRRIRCSARLISGGRVPA